MNDLRFTHGTQDPHIMGHLSATYGVSGLLHQLGGQPFMGPQVSSLSSQVPDAEDNHEWNILVQQRKFVMLLKSGVQVLHQSWKQKSCWMTAHLDIVIPHSHLHSHKYRIFCLSHHHSHIEQHNLIENSYKYIYNSWWQPTLLLTMYISKNRMNLSSSTYLSFIYEISIVNKNWKCNNIITHKTQNK